MRQRRARREVLVGRRHGGHVFLPGMYVFPGGALDRGDYRCPCASDLSPDVYSVLTRHVARKRARALAVAALRETWEESGWAIGRIENGRLLPALHGIVFVARAITPAAMTRRFHARFFAARCESADASSRPPSDELQDLHWVDVERSQESLPMLNVTRYVIARVAALHQWRQPASVPLLCFRAGKVVVRHG